ncbi:lipopolysaccharide biosynthesis protein [Streptomyces sp. cg36]|uniref:lipopolysaccharide biosynthesis protein n=1 Tax=Streptomyces sp. cg36 TaxID=3238798 RepID=UPI0034E1EFE8
MSDTTSGSHRAVGPGAAAGGRGRPEAGGGPEHPEAAGGPQRTEAGGGPQRPEPGGAPPDRAADGRDSMFRNAYALMLSTAVSAALGLGFWLVAARYYSEEAVGRGSAAIAAMRLLASIAATTMMGAVVRYVPRAGRATGPLVVRAYLASTGVVAVASVGFLLTLPRWGASYAPLGGPGPGILFTLAAVAWSVLTLQDGVLTGLRKAVWVPVGNAVFSLGKLLLLAAFAGLTLGVFVSWAAAMALSILPLGLLVFRRLIPAQAAADHDRPVPEAREIVRFLAGDSVGALFSLAMINLLPVLVAVRFDAAQNGFFYIAYTVGGTMEFMAINMASSLTAHASHSPDRLADGVRGALRRMVLLLVPVIAFLIAFAPRILAPFGADYAEHGTPVLRLLAAAALPRVAVELWIGVLRVQGRTGVLALLQGAMCTLVLGSAAVLLRTTGIEGAGWAVLVSMTVMALVSAPGLRAALAGRATVRAARGDGAEEYGTGWARRAALARAEEAKGYGTRWTTQTAYLSGGLDTGTPALGIPVYVPGASAGASAGAGSGSGSGGSAGTLRLRAVGPDGGPDGASAGAVSGSGSGSGSGGSASTLRLRAVGPGGEPDGGPDGARWAGRTGGADGALPAGRTGGADGALWAGRTGGPDESLWAGRTGGPNESLWAGKTGGPDESLLAGALWVLLGLAAGLFWVPLSRVADIGSERVDGAQLFAALPPVSLTAGVLLVVVCSAAVSLCRARPALLAAALGVTVAALHTAPLILGVRPDPLRGPWHEPLARMLSEVAGLGSPAGAERWLPPVLQLLCLGLVVVTLTGLGVRWRVTSVLVWVLAVTGWAAQSAFARAGVPVFVGLCVCAALATLWGHAAPRARDLG